MRYGLMLTLAVLVCSLPALAGDAAMAAIFSRYGLQGTLVLSSLNTGRTFVHQDVRASRPVPVASTFKIPNTLIALEEQVIGRDDILHWDGQPYAIADWNRDQTLASAFKVSCVWCYQELARRIGGDKYRHYLQRMHYGHLREPFVTTEFWLDGSLVISAREQVDFLRRLQQRELGFGDAAYQTLRDIMLVEQTPNYALRAKTGWAGRATPQIGWYVGYVETTDDVWYFATQVDINDERQLPLRLQLTRSVLQQKGILP